MSLLTLIKAQFGKSNTPANNFVLDASAENGTMKLARGNAGATTQDILTVDAAGLVTFTQGQSSVGYVSGQGGAVTQLDSKSTAVTLNKLCGQITMNNAALGAGSRAGFQCVNSLVTAKDTIVASIDNTSPASAGYSYSVSASASMGAIVFVIKNDSTGSLSDAVRINFAIIKGATE